MPIYPYRGKSPKIHSDALVSPYATIIGHVEISEGASVFPGAVLRGDSVKINLGKYSNIQDNVVLHGGDVQGEDDTKSTSTVEIGDYVTVAHGSVVHGSKVESVSMVGINAVIFEASTIGEGSIIGMNATVLKDTNIPPRSVVVGVPAKVVKKVDNTTYSMIKRHAQWYHKLAKSHQGTIF